MEIERKYLVRPNFSVPSAPSVRIIQGYPASGDGVSVRVRLAGAAGFLTLKGPPAQGGVCREEFEYPIPPEDAERMIRMFCGGRIVEKTRSRVEFGGRMWDVDRFSGANRGLIIAEVEFDDPHETVHAPPWILREVTGDNRYANRRLALHPYALWAPGEPPGTSM